MNILQAYVFQKGQFVVVFSSPDESLLKEIVLNLADDFGAQFINLYPYLKNLEDIDNTTISKMLNVEKKILFIIGPAFPTYYIKNLKYDYHVSVSLNNTLVNERGVNLDVLKTYEKYGSITYSFKENKKNHDIRSSINKTLNLSKFENNKSLEDEIFNLLVETIEKKLDGGKYIEKKSNVKQEDVKDKIVFKRGEYSDTNTDSMDDYILEEVNLNTYMSDDDIMSEVNFETANSNFIVGGVRKLNK